MTKKVINRKVRNATPTTFKGLKFRSRLEKRCYEEFVSANLPIEYEPKTRTIWEGFRPEHLKLYVAGRGKKRNTLSLNTYLQRDTQMTTDFLVRYKGYEILLEVKGFPNDVYPLKRKMLLKILEERAKNGEKIMFIEVNSIAHIKQAIKIIQNLDD